jgi:hypothetical protein
MKIDWDDSRYAAGDCIGCFEDAAIESAIANRDDPFRVGRGRPGPMQRFAHIGRDGAGHQQHIGMTRRGDEAQTEPLDVVERVVERVDFEFAAVARAGIDLADRQAAAKPAPRRLIDLL